MADGGQGSGRVSKATSLRHLRKSFEVSLKFRREECFDFRRRWTAWRKVIKTIYAFPAETFHPAPANNS